MLDCDFDTEYEYFNVVQEIYLVQSLDVLTIQPLTAFLRELKAKDVLDPNKIRIVIRIFFNIRMSNTKSRFLTNSRLPLAKTHAKRIQAKV